MRRKLIAEFIGTFFIVFGGCGSVIADSYSGGTLGSTGIGLTFGIVVMTMIYTLGHISGAHFNPAVTIAFSVSRHFPKKEVIPYIVAQILGAIFGAFVLYIATDFANYPNAHFGVTLPFDDSVKTVIIWEFILTFLLMFVIMGVATDYRAVKKASGLAIGGYVAGAATFGGYFTGASMNPARSIGPAIIMGNYNFLVIYVVTTIVGAVSASLLYCYLKRE